jgi:CDGSH-type Zn-finger protein
MSDVKVQVLKDGPLLVGGKVALTGVDGQPIETQQDPIALCRCGHSAKKPFCDGGHKKASFQG